MTSKLKKHSSLQTLLYYNKAGSCLFCLCLTCLSLFQEAKAGKGARGDVVEDPLGGPPVREPQQIPQTSRQSTHSVTGKIHFL